MDEQRSPAPTAQTPPAAFGRADLGLLLLLLLAAAGLRSWQLAHTEVAARDSIGYVRIAWQLEHDGDWPRVVRTAAQHPGYPAVLLLVSGPVRYFAGDDLPMAMQRSAQLTSVFAAILLVVPMFLLGRGTFDRRVGFVAALLFQCLPTSGRLMADGLSEPVFLLWTCTAFLCASYGLRKGSPWWFAGVGSCGGLAYLTRPEGALVVAATGLVLVGLQAFARWRRPWLSLAQSGGLLAWAALTVAGPFVLIVGHLTTKNTPLQIMKGASAQAPVKAWEGEGEEQEDQPAARKGAADSALPPATTTVTGGPAWDDKDHPPPRSSTGWLLFVTFAKCFFYVTWVPALVGLVVARDRFRLAPVSWVMAVVCGALCYVIYRVPVVMGYLSDRHTVLILFCSVFWTAAGTLRLGDGCAWLVTDIFPARAEGAGGRGLTWAAVLLLPLLAGALVKTLEPLHTDRLPFREAGYWLARNTHPGDKIDDPYCWASYYAGRVFTENNSNLPHGDPPRVYVVVEQSANKPPRLHPKTSSKDVAEKGRLLKTWPVKRGKELALVVIYEVLQ
jgi:4-amino-4-deoxy-L-arabinose transferase-like glycosyltransferase